MKSVKMLGLLAVVAAATMVFAAGASATILTSPAGTQVAKDTVIHASSEGATTLDGPAKITCNKSTVKGKVGNAGGAGVTVSGAIEELTFEECNQHVTVETKGELIVHTQYTKEAGGHETEQTAANGNGTLTSNGAKVKVVLTGLGIECVYSTSNTDIGNLTGSINITKKATATLDIDSSPIPRTGGSGGIFCGASAEWTGSYKVETPDYLDVD